MAEEVMLWAIESLDCWLLKKKGLMEENDLEKLYSLIVGMSDLGEEKKEMLHTLLLGSGMEENGYETDRNKVTMYNLLDLNKEKMYSLVVGMAEEVMLSVIESLDCWLLKKRGLMEENDLEKLYSLIVGMSDLGEEKKEMVHTLLLQIGMEEERERNIEKLYNLLDFNEVEMLSLLVGMADFWGDHKGKLYHLLFQVEINQVGPKVNLNCLLHSLLVKMITSCCGGDKRELNKEKLHSLLVEIADMWGDDEGELNKEKLHSLLFQMLNKDNYLEETIMGRMSGEVAGLWKDKQPKLNKEKLYTWLANKMDHCEPKKLFGVLLYTSSHVHKEIRAGVEGAKLEFRMILDLIRDKKLGEETSLRYFISDVVDMAHHAHFLIQLQDSHPFALFFELSVLQALEHQTYYKWFSEEFKRIANGLQEIKVNLGKVGSTMAEPVIIWAIKSLECWLCKKGGLVEGNLEKVYSLIVGNAYLGEEKKAMVHSLLLQFGLEKDMYERERKKEKLYNLLEMNKKKMYSLVVGMADFWEDYKGKLYYLLFQVGNRVDLKGKIYPLQHSLREKITNRCGGNKRELNKEKLHSFLVEIADMWGDDEGELNKEKLHSLLFEMLNKDNYSEETIMGRMSGEVAGLWKDKQPKLNKGKLHAWLANKVDLCEPEKLFAVLLDMVLLYDSSSYFHEAIREGVEGAKREFRMILDLVTDEKMGEESSLCYFISSNVVDMAHHARFLIQLQDSDPFALYFELSEYQALEHQTDYKWFSEEFKHIANGLQEHQTYYKWFSEEFKHIVNGLQEIKVYLEKVGSNMAEAVILWAIKSLECWLHKKGNLVEENLENLYSLIVGMSDLGEEKEIVHSLLLRFGMEMFEYEGEGNLEKLYRLTSGMSDLGEKKKEMLHRLLAGSRFPEEETVKMFYKLLDMNKEKMKSLVVGMADFWEDNNEKLYNLLFLVAVILKDEELKKEKLQSLLVEITDMWGDDEGELNKKKLHSLLFQMLNENINSKKKIWCRMSGKVAGLWKYKQPKLNKEKLYTWLANKLDLSEPEKLLSVLLYASSHVPKEIREGVEGAKGEFRMILDFITDKKLEEESSLRYFISDVVDIAHHAHSLIHLKDSHPFALFCGLTVYKDPRHEIYYPIWFGEKFKHIVKELQEIKDSMLGSRVERSQNVIEMKGGEHVLGLEAHVKSLLDDSYITVIKGMGGIGKTTLARQVYNHTTIAQQFQRRAWVGLSSKVVDSRKEILVSLLRQLVDSNELALLEKIEHADYESLKQVLHQQFQRERCFIVLDDVWDNTTHFKYIMKALPKGIKGRSRLLLTTRSVSMRYSYGVNYHEMKSMDDDKSWTLLLKMLSTEGSDEKFPKPLVKKARQILKKNCSGLPLAIKEVGRHWAKKRQSGSEWEELIESIDLSETLRALESSYDNWNPELKSYFLHLAFFKEGATIRAKRLVHIWKVMGVRIWEDQDGLQKLLNESVLDATDMGYAKSYIRNIKTCSIHAIFHMLSIRKAEDELNFEIINKDGSNRPSHEPHHRVIYCSREKLMMNYSSNQDKHLVSLFFYGGGYFNSSDPSYWKHFERLKTLDMEDFGLKILPDAIGTLSELRYLGLRNNYIQEIPHSLSRLKKLEVLDIALNFMVEVEDIIWGMESLCHLYMTDISFRKLMRIDALKNLKTWTYISVHNWMYEKSKLEMMRSLTKLGIQEVDGNTDVSKLFASLAELTNLKFLILRGFCFKSMPSLDEIGVLQKLEELKLDGLITRLPSANNFPPNIINLSLVNSCLHEDPMPILEKLSNLTYIKLQNAYTGQQMLISHNGFSKLEFLVIKELWHLKNVQIEKGAMKELRDMEINNCPYLDTLPEDYFPLSYMVFKMKTTKKNATKIRKSSFVSRISKVDIQP